MPKNLKNFRRTQKKTAKRIGSTDAVPTLFSSKKIEKRLRSTEGVGDKLAGLTDMSGVESRKSRRPRDDPFSQIGL